MYEKILVPVDGSSTAERALNEAIGLARLAGSRIELLHVMETLGTGFETPEAYQREVLPAFARHGEQLLQHAATIVRTAGIPVDTKMVAGEGERVSHYIVEQARSGGANLIVLGTHGRRGVHHALIGSDAERVARTAPVPVMLVHATG